MNRVLVVEDEQHLAEGLRFNLEAEGYSARTCETGEEAIELLAPEPPGFDIVVLDIMLPGMDGFAVARELRGKGKFLPVLMLTARGRPDDVLKGFEAGADDYLTKPFELPILLARLNSLLRRSNWHRAAQPVRAPQAVTNDQFQFAGKTINFNALELHVADRILPLTLMEANLLRYLIDHQNTVVSRKQILEQVWGVREDTDTRAIDNFIVRLRKYIEKETSQPKHLVTVRGVGYRFVPEPEQK
jgi:DNA-binding response OmpR family regulator